MFLCWPPTRVRVVVSDFERSTSCRRERAGSGRLHRLSYCQSRYTKASHVRETRNYPFTRGEGQGSRWHPKFFQLTTLLSDAIIPVDSVLPRLKYLLNLLLVVGATGTEAPQWCECTFFDECVDWREFFMMRSVFAEPLPVSFNQEQQLACT